MNDSRSVQYLLKSLPENIEPIPDIFLALQQEIHKNEKLMVYMMDEVSDADGPPERLGKIAAYYNIEMNGVYNLMDVARVLYNEVRKDNSILVLPTKH